MHFINTFKPSGGEKPRQIDGFIPICIGLTPKKEPFRKRCVCARSGKFQTRSTFKMVNFYPNHPVHYFSIFLQLTFLFYAKCVLVVQVETYFKLNNLVVVRTLLEPSTTLHSRIRVQCWISIQVGQFSKKNKNTGLNKSTDGSFSAIFFSKIAQKWPNFQLLSDFNKNTVSNKEIQGGIFVQNK